jgi:hypothetical protein
MQVAAVFGVVEHLTGFRKHARRQGNGPVDRSVFG